VQYWYYCIWLNKGEKLKRAIKRAMELYKEVRHLIVVDNSGPW
jgi:hypothetical protein